jgi:LPXTG-motif cell wall-anchored protein
VNAFSVQIRFQATDFVSTTNSNPHPTGPVIDAQSPSTGAKAGIGVGVAIGVLALLLLGALLIRRRRRKPRTDQTPVTEQTPLTDQTPYGIDTKQELDGTSYATPKVKDVSPPVAEVDAAEPHTQANLTSTEPSLVAPHARSEDAVELPSLAASRVVNSSVAYPQELADAVPETRSAVSAPHEARLREVEGEHDIQQQIKRIREEKERLTRINELERLEAELQERLAGPTST